MMTSTSALAGTTMRATPTLRGHIQIMRIDHWFKNVFVLPGIIAAIGVDASRRPAAWLRIVLVGMLSICLVASSNYVINEVLDAPSDRSHPVKRNRPVPSGQREHAAGLRPVDCAARRSGSASARWYRRPFAITVVDPVGHGLRLQHPADSQ